MNDQTNQDAEAVAPISAPKLTYAEKIAKRAKFLYDRIVADTAEYNGLKNEIDNAEALKNLAPGSVITIKLGRKFADRDTTRFEEATILGMSVNDEGATLYKVSYGEGFNMEVAVVAAGAIVSVNVVEAEVAAS